jgi:exonuclease VII small subunit
VRLADVFQVSRQVVDELERGELPLDLQHAA